MVDLLATERDSGREIDTWFCYCSWAESSSKWCHNGSAHILGQEVMMGCLSLFMSLVVSFFFLDLWNLCL